MDEASQKHSTNSKAPGNDGEKRIQRQREILLLARARVVQQLAASPNERYTESRRQALKELDEKLASLPVDS